MNQVFSMLASADPATMFQSFLAVITATMWIRIEHRLTKIESNCTRCRYKEEDE